MQTIVRFGNAILGLLNYLCNICSENILKKNKQHIYELDNHRYCSF